MKVNMGNIESLNNCMHVEYNQIEEKKYEYDVKNGSNAKFCAKQDLSRVTTN